MVWPGSLRLFARFVKNQAKTEIYLHSIRYGKVVDFASLARQGSRARGKHLASRVLLKTSSELPAPNTPAGKNTAAFGSMMVLTGIIVSKKAVDKRAVLRNRVKRKLRPIVRMAVAWLLENKSPASLAGQTEPSAPTSQPEQAPSLVLSWVVRAERSALEASTEELLNDVRTTLVQAFEREATRLGLDRLRSPGTGADLQKTREPDSLRAPGTPLPLLPDVLRVHG